MTLTQEQLAQKKESLAARSEQFYEEKLRDLLEPAYDGHFVVIEPDAGRYFLGPTDVAATNAARQALPDGLFFMMRVGYKTAYTMGGSVVRSRR